MSSPSKTDTPDFKAKLDKAAMRAQNPPEDHTQTKGQGSAIIEKVAQYIPEPLSSKILDHQNKKDEKPRSPPPVDQSVAPRRPDHDENIEEFIRDQHRSTGLSLEE